MKWRPYPKYKDSGVEWLGQVPEQWRVSRLKYIAAKKKFAIVDGPFGTQLKSEDYRDSGIPLIRISNLSYEGNFSNEDLVFIDPNKALEVDRSKISRGDIVIGKTGATIGKSALIGDFDYAIIASSCIKISPNINFIIPEFLIDFVVSDGFVKEIINTSGGSTRDTINLLPFSNLGIVVPTIKEQKTIASFLDRETTKIDTLISKQERLIELLQEKRKALISHAVTKGLNPDAPMKDSGVEWLGKVPEHWIVTLLKHGYEITLGKMLQTIEKSKSDLLLPYIRAANIQLEEVSILDIKEMWISENERNQLLLQYGDLLVSEGGDVGRCAIWKSELIECYFQNSVNRIRSSKGNSNRFLYYFILNTKEAGFIDIICNKATIAHFTAEKVGILPIVLPPIAEQQAITTFLDRENAKIDALIEKSRRSIELMKEHRSALISAAVTGKIDVREAV